MSEDGIAQDGPSGGESLDGSLTVGGVTVAINDLTINNTEQPVGTGGTRTVFTIAGDSSVSIPGLPTLEVFVTGTVADGALESFALQLQSGFTFTLDDGVTVSSTSANPLTLTDSIVDDIFTFSGGAKVDAPGLSSLLPFAASVRHVSFVFFSNT